MFNSLTHNVFSQITLNIAPFWIVVSLLVSLGLGFVLAGLYRYRTAYSKEFAVTLTVLPILISVIIFLVNGNLGTSVAVAGTFSLIRFRSPASSAKELLLVFMATAIGLATGMGYLILAMVVTLVVTIVLLFLEHASFAQPRFNQRQLTISLPLELADELALTKVLTACCQKVELLTLKTKKDHLELVYQVLLQVSEYELINHLKVYDERIAITLTATKTKKKSL